MITSTVSLKELLLVLQVKYDTPQVFLNTNEPFVLILFDKFIINHTNKKLLVFFPNKPSLCKFVYRNM